MEPHILPPQAHPLLFSAPLSHLEFERELTRALGLAKRNDLRHMVAYMDLDQFKVINNSAGHEAGDKLLQDIAGLLREKLSDVKATFGSQAIAGIASPRCTNEDNYIFQKFMRAAVGTNNIDTTASAEKEREIDLSYITMAPPPPSHVAFLQQHMSKRLQNNNDSNNELDDVGEKRKGNNCNAAPTKQNNHKNSTSAYFARQLTLR